MAVAIGKADHLILNRGTIAWTAARYTATIDSGLLNVLRNDVVRLLIRMSDRTGNLRNSNPVRHEAKRDGLLIGLL